MAKEIDIELLRSPELSKIKEGDSTQNVRDVADFCINEMLSYAREVCSHRAIPSCIDGLKESTRKILWCAKDKLKAPLKVYQLGGIVSSEMAYTHGDISLNGAIISLAQPHNSNIPMLDGIGQFGSYHFRDAAKPRYVSVKLSNLFNYLFLDNDQCVPQFSEGMECEPLVMLPIIPYCLCNNNIGIASGFANKTLARNTTDIIKECIKAVKCLRKGTEIKAKLITPDIPEFKGNFTPNPKGPNIWDVHGVYTVSKKLDAIHITEFIGTMIPFKEALKNKRDEKVLTYIENSDKTIDVKMKAGNKVTASLLEDLFLESSFVENPTFVDEKLDVVVFNHVGEIIPKFVPYRAEFYKERLKRLIDKTSLDIIITTNRIRFIKEHEMFYKKPNIEKLLSDAKYDKVYDSYEYLLSMRVDTITLEKIKQLDERLKELKEKLKKLKATDYLDLYESDLNTLLSKIPTKTKE